MLITRRNNRVTIKFGDMLEHEVAVSLDSAGAAETCRKDLESLSPDNQKTAVVLLIKQHL